MSSIVGTIEKEEYLKSELPAIQQLQAMGYQYKSQSELNKEREIIVKFYYMIDWKQQLENIILNLTKMEYMRRYQRLMNLNFHIPLILWTQMKE